MNPRDILVPDSIRSLLVDPVRKVPVPWFVAWIDGKPEFRVADEKNFTRAIRERLCWVCGTKLADQATYVVGPMCAINRVTSEPPCHPACAVYSAQACPFLSRPGMTRRDGNLPAETTSSGIAIERNPGVSCLWQGRVPGSRPFDDGNGGILFRLDAPLSVSWWAEGRPATRVEVDASVATGLPTLKEMARKQGAEARFQLTEMILAARPIFAMCG